MSFTYGQERVGWLAGYSTIWCRKRTSSFYGEKVAVV
jgi:hypothetical protein